MDVLRADEPSPTEGNACVRQLLKECRGIHPSTKDVLAEICALYENGGEHQFRANNQFLATKLGMTEPMISRHIANLEERGLLLVQRRTDGHKRLLTPIPELQAAYRSGKKEKITEVVNAFYRSGKKLFTEVVKIPYRSGKHKSNKEEVKKEEINRVDVLVEQHNANVAALAALTLERDQLLARLAKAKEEFRALRLENDKLKAKKPSKKKGALPTTASKRHKFEDSPYADLQLVIEKLKGTDYEHAHAQFYHERIKNWALSKGELKIDWLATIRNAMLADSRDNKLKMDPSSKLTPYVDPKRSAEQRKEFEQRNGLVDSGKLAASIAAANALGF